jgi:hypothetical protein
MHSLEQTRQRAEPSIAIDVVAPGIVSAGGVQFEFAQRPPDMSLREWISETLKNEGIRHHFDDTWMAARALKESLATSPLEAG